MHTLISSECNEGRSCPSELWSADGGHASSEDAVSVAQRVGVMSKQTSTPIHTSCILRRLYTHWINSRTRLIVDNIPPTVQLSTSVVRSDLGTSVAYSARRLR